MDDDGGGARGTARWRGGAVRAVVRAASRTEEEARTTTVARWPLGGAVLRWRAVVRAASRTEEEARRRFCRSVMEEEARRDGGERDGAGDEFGGELVDGGGGTGNFGSLTA